MVQERGGRCEICEKPAEELVIDHDHVAKVVRGVICRQCNLMLGYAGDRPEILQRAALYLNFCRLAMARRRDMGVSGPSLALPPKDATA